MDLSFWVAIAAFIVVVVTAAILLRRVRGTPAVGAAAAVVATGTIAQRLALLRTMIRWTGYISILLIVALIGSQGLILVLLPSNPSPALIGLLQTGQTGLVAALGAMVGALAMGIGSYFTFRSAAETSGQETPSAP